MREVVSGDPDKTAGPRRLPWPRGALRSWAMGRGRAPPAPQSPQMLQWGFLSFTLALSS